MLEDACRANPDAQGILITRPNYYGIAKNLDEIVEIANKFKMPLLVDEAHGAHFIFHEAFPSPCGFRCRFQFKLNKPCLP